jgi:ABC-2 type transport system ATP-binding protein
MVNMATNGVIVETADLAKRYEGGIQALSDVSLKVEEGDIFGLIGPNGAGKSTMIKILTGLLNPTSGTATVAGFDVQREAKKVKGVTGYLPENSGYYENLTARQNIEYFAEFYGMTRDERKEKADTLLGMLGMGQWEDEKVGRFSKGMRQRLGIAVSVVNDPAVAFLDEPTHGLDPYGMAQIRQLIGRMNREMGVTIILSTHLLFEVAEVCKTVGILASGRMIATGETNALSMQLRDESQVKYHIEMKVDAGKTSGIAGEIEQIQGVVQVEVDGREMVVIANAGTDPREAISRAITGAGGAVLSFEEDTPSLEDVFLKVYEESQVGGETAPSQETGVAPREAGAE